MRVPLASGDAVQMTHGPQGGWHIETAGLVSSGRISVHPTITVPEPATCRSSATRRHVPGARRPRRHDLRGHLLRGEGLHIDTNQSPVGGQEFVCGLDGKTLHYVMEVADIVSGRTATAEVDVVAHLDPADEEICATGG
ncbi:MAG: hypothetical protein R3F59_33445 [Myxococcota bacterium]